MLRPEHENRAFVSSFWGSHDAGLQVIEGRIADALTSMHSLCEYYQQRATIETEYGKKLEKLASKQLGKSRETGSLLYATNVFDTQQHAMARNSQKFAESIHATNHNRLKDFSTTYKQTTQKMINHMRRLASKEKEAYVRVTRAKAKYREECISVKRMGLLAQTTFGKELDKCEASRKKLEQLVPELRHQYLLALSYYQDVLENYQRDWQVSLLDLYRLECERINFMKVNCFGFLNNIATHCVENDLAADYGRQAYAKVQPVSDLEEYAAMSGNSDRIYRAPEFIEYSEGLVDDDDDLDAYDRARFKDPVLGSLSRLPSGIPANETPKKLPPITLAPPTTTKQALPTATKQLRPLSISSLAPAQPRESPRRRLPSDSSSLFSEPKSNFGGSGVSQPLTVSTDLTGDRHWASPRRKERQLQQYQEEIDLRARQDHRLSQSTSSSPTRPQNKVSLVKDFSIDFIAKALEDLQHGGDGDVNQYRRSMRSERLQQSSPHTLAETTARTDSINFNSPRRLPQRSNSKNHRRLLGMPSTSYPDLHSIVERKDVTPYTRKPYVSKARARYAFSPREEGELYFKKGWHMYVIYKQEDNWFLCELAQNAGENAGEVGLVPGNYIVEEDGLF